MRHGRKVYSGAFTRPFIRGGAKPLPEKKHKSAYHLCMEEAFADLMIDDDETYLKRIIKDLEANAVTINNFRSLELISYVNGTKLSNRLYMNGNKILIKIFIPTYTSKIKVLITPYETIPPVKYISNVGIREKVKTIQNKLNEIYSE